MSSKFRHFLKYVTYHYGPILNLTTIRATWQILGPYKTTRSSQLLFDCALWFSTSLSVKRLNPRWDAFGHTSQSIQSGLRALFQYREIRLFSKSREVVGSKFRIVGPSWNSTGEATTLLRRRLSNFRTIQQLYLPILQLPRCLMPRI